jgi:1,4-dihydroxy-2-naphthoyl-CoA hydrolase
MPDSARKALPKHPTGLDETLGISYEKLEPGEVIATMPVTPRHHQPLGYLHGGASVVLAESVASIGGFLLAEEGKVTFGMEINANHLRPKRDGLLRAVGHPVFTGRSTQVWEVRITDEQDRLICISRCTLAVVDAKQQE